MQNVRLCDDVLIVERILPSISGLSLLLVFRTALIQLSQVLYRLQEFAGTYCISAVWNCIPAVSLRLTGRLTTPYAVIRGRYPEIESMIVENHVRILRILKNLPL